MRAEQVARAKKFKAAKAAKAAQAAKATRAAKVTRAAKGSAARCGPRGRCPRRLIAHSLLARLRGPFQGVKRLTCWVLALCCEWFRHGRIWHIPNRSVTAAGAMNRLSQASQTSLDECHRRCTRAALRASMRSPCGDGSETRITAQVYASAMDHGCHTTASLTPQEDDTQKWCRRRRPRRRRRAWRFLFEHRRCGGRCVLTTNTTTSMTSNPRSSDQIRAPWQEGNSIIPERMDIVCGTIRHVVFVRRHVELTASRRSKWRRTARSQVVQAHSLWIGIARFYFWKKTSHQPVGFLVSLVGALI